MKLTDQIPSNFRSDIRKKHAEFQKDLKDMLEKHKDKPVKNVKDEAASILKKHGFEE